jgi:hypothetical protein
MGFLAQIRNRFASESAAPTPVATAPEVSREAKLLAELRDAERELDALNQVMRDFRQTHFVFLDGRIAIRSSKPFEGDQISRQWLSFGQTRMQLIQKRADILKQWADAKGALT